MSSRLQKAEEALTNAGKDADHDVLNTAFDAIFDVVQDARVTGHTEECNQLLLWATSCSDLHLEALLPCLRLTANFRHLLPAWPALKQHTASVIVAWDENVEALLWGL